MVSEAEIHHACDVIDARGEEPKYEAIRLELGGHGSWSTIKKYRASWLAREDEVPPVPDALHAHLTAIGAVTWRLAYPLASGTFGEERHAAQVAEAELVDALEHAQAEVREKVATIARLTEAVDDLRARLATSETGRREEAERQASLAREVATLTNMTASLQTLMGVRGEPGPALRIVGAGEPVRDERGS